GAPEAQLLYLESEESKQRREQESWERKQHVMATMPPPRRPTKKQRRDIHRFREQMDSDARAGIPTTLTLTGQNTQIISSHDQCQRFLLDNLHIRGGVVRLDESVAQVLRRHQYPKPVQHLLGQSTAAVVLMGATLKIEGSITLQAKGSGPLTLLMAESSHRR